jgi:hypothetical protein
VQYDGKVELTYDRDGLYFAMALPSRETGLGRS